MILYFKLVRVEPECEWRFSYGPANQFLKEPTKRFKFYLY